MKKRVCAGIKNSSEFKGKCEKVAQCLPMNMKQIVFAVVFLIFVFPINKQALADKEIKPGRRQAVLILSDGSKIVLNTNSDTIVNSKSTNVRIKIDSTGINYFMIDSIKKLNQVKSKSVKKK